MIGPSLTLTSTLILREKFATVDAIGLRWAAEVVSEAGDAGFDTVACDAFERVQVFFDRLGGV